MQCNLLISDKFEMLNCAILSNLKSDFSLFGIEKERTVYLGKFCIDVLNSFDEIIKTLEESIKLTDKPLYILCDFLKERLLPNISDIIIYEIDNYFVKNIEEKIKIKDNIKLLKNELLEYHNILNNDILYQEYYDNLIKETEMKIAFHNDYDYLNELKEEKKDKVKGIKSINFLIKETKEEIEEEKRKQDKLKGNEELLKEYIKKLIETIIEYKQYFDLYNGYLGGETFKKKDISYFQALLGAKITIPKFYMYNSFEKKGKVIPLNNLFWELAKEKKEEKGNLTGDDITILENDSFDITKKLNTNKEILHCRLYEISTLKDILNIYLSYFIENKINIKKCKNCNKYFMPLSRADEKYCNNISPQKNNKTCRQYASKEIYKEKINSNIIKKTHETTSQFFRMRINRSKKNENKKDEKYFTKVFNRYKEEYNKQLKRYNNKQILEEEFVQWMIEQKTIHINKKSK